MNILSKIFAEPKEREAFFHRIYLFPETLDKLKEMKEILKEKTNHRNRNEKQEAEIFRKIIGIAYHDLKHDAKNDKKRKTYRKFLIIKKQGKQKKEIEYYLKRAI